MLAEAYFVLLLYTVVELYGKPSSEVEEDYKCVPGFGSRPGEGVMFGRSMGGRGYALWLGGG